MERRVFLYLFLGLFLISSAHGATYHVKKDGTGDFATIQGCADVAVAGDTCLIYQGKYNEIFRVRNSGSPGNYISFRTIGQVETNGTRVDGNYVHIEGFAFVGQVRMYGSWIDIYGNHSRIINNIGRGPNTVSSSFISTRGSHGYIANNYITGFIQGTMIQTVARTSSNNLIENNTITHNSDIDAFRVFGNGHIIRKNAVINITDGPIGNHIDFIQTFGDNGVPSYDITVDGNYVMDLVGQISQLSQMCGLNYTGGNGQSCDKMYGVNGKITSLTANSITDNAIDWIIGRWGINHWKGFVVSFVDGDALGNIYLIDSSTSNTLYLTDMQGNPVNLINDGVKVGDSYEIRVRVGWWTFTNNVFINAIQLSNGLPHMRFIGNTLANIPQIGVGSSTARGRAFHNEIYNNAYLNPHSSSMLYPVSSSDVSKSFYADYNYVSSGPLNYEKKPSNCPQEYTSFNFCEEQFGKNGINGGDPLFQNVRDPLGPDGIFGTDDDGLIPLAGSPLCYAGKDGETIGAYDCRGCINNNPIAFFSPNRLNGYEPLAVNFDASNSLSCASSITSYSWNFGDGATFSGKTTSHTFSSGSFTVTLTVTNDLGRSSTYQREIAVYPSTVPNLVLYLDFDNNLVDMTGRYREITADVNPVVYGPGISGSAVFNDEYVQNYITIPHSEDLEGMDRLSISIWIKKLAPNSNGVFLNKHTSYSARFYADNRFGFAFYNDTSSSSIISNLDNLDTDWHHYVAVADGTNMKLYFDGQFIASAPFSGTIKKSGRRIVIGKDEWGPYFNGSIDEFRIYDKALSSEEVLYLFENPGLAPVTTCSSGADTSGNGAVEMAELMNFISAWKSGSVAMNSLMAAIGEWKNGC